MKRQFPILAANITLVLVTLAHSAGIVTLPALDRLENFFYDLRTTLTLPGGIDERIVIVDIDERSLREQGHWPWSRSKLAYLVDQLFDRYQIAALGFDVVFAEKDESREISALRQVAEEKGRVEFISELDDMAAGLDRDQRFAKALADRPVVLGYYFNTNPERTISTGLLPQPLNFDETVKQSLFAPEGSSYGANIPVLQEAAGYGGFFSNPLVGQDAIVRRVPTVHEYKGHLYESFAIAVARSYLGMDIEPDLVESDADTDYPSLEGIYVGPFRVPIDVNGGALVPYRGRSGSFPYISATDVLHDNVPDPETLRDAIVLVGTTSLGLVDIRATPMQGTFPGVEVHANVIAGVIDENFKHNPAWVWGAEFTILAVIGLLMMILSPFLGPLKLWFFTLLILFTVVGANIYFWNEQNLVIPLANSVVLVIVLYVFNVMYGFFAEARQKRQVRNAFSHYLAPAMVTQLMEDPGKLRLTGEAKELTFLFTDIAGFTTFSEQNTPEVLVGVLNEYLDGMCNIAMSHGGTIDKIIGDAMVVMFNAPVDQPDHANRAVACALEMDEFCTKFKAEKDKEGFSFGITRIGVNTGIATVGNFGGKERFDYTALGDTINTAARMESVNKHLGTRVCISGTTVAQCEDVLLRPIGGLVLKGKSEPVQAYEPISREKNESDFMQKYREAYKRLEQEHPKARESFAELNETYPDDPLVKLHHTRITAGETSSIITMTEK